MIAKVRSSLPVQLLIQDAGDPAGEPVLAVDLPAVAHMLYGLGDIRMRRVFIEQEEAGDERKRREDVAPGLLERGGPPRREHVVGDGDGPAARAGHPRPAERRHVGRGPRVVVDGPSLPERHYDAVVRAPEEVGPIAASANKLKAASTGTAVENLYMAYLLRRAALANREGEFVREAQPFIARSRGAPPQLAFEVFVKAEGLLAAGDRKQALSTLEQVEHLEGESARLALARFAIFEFLHSGFCRCRFVLLIFVPIQRGENQDRRDYNRLVRQFWLLKSWPNMSPPTENA